MSCIICQESGPEPLHENTNCSCKYKRHNSCWIDYVHSTTKVKCLLCRKEIVAPPKTQSTLNKPRTPVQPISDTLPYSQPLLPSGQRITYQEFCEIVNSHNNSYQNADINITITPSNPIRSQPVRTQQPNTSSMNKFLKIVLGLAIVVAIVVVLVIVL
jgi:hypothetical protein